MPFLTKPALIAAAAAGALALAGCTDGYGYSGVSVGYGSTGYYDDGYYGNGYYDNRYGSPYWGWYNNYYYPGTGVYVYDSNRRRYRWNQAQRHYWETRRQAWRGDRRNMRSDWRDFRRDERRDYRDDRRDWRQDRRDDRRDWRQDRREHWRWRRDGN